MVPNEYLRQSSVRTPYGQGLSIQADGDLNIGPYGPNPATSISVLIAPASRAPDSGFRVSRTIQYADGKPPRRTPFPGVHATREEAFAVFRKWSERNLTLNLPLKSKREHLKQGAYFYAGFFGSDLCRVTAVSKSGRMQYEWEHGRHTTGQKEFLKWARTAANPTPEEVSELDRALLPKPKPVDPFDGAVRRQGALNWESNREYAEAELGNGPAWRTERSDTDGDLFSLFRRDSNADWLWKPDEHSACAVARTRSEAWILAELLEGSSGRTSEPSEDYVPTYVDGERRGWVRKTDTGHITLHQGSDEDPRDVVVSQFSSNSPYEVMHVAWIKFPRQPLPGFGEGPWDRGPIKGADLMGAALALTDLLIRSGRLASPLDWDDWKAWQHGLDIKAAPPAPAWTPPPRANGCSRDPGVVEAALEALERDPQPREDLCEAAREALIKLVSKDYFSKQPQIPFSLIALSRDVSAQYTLAADLLGKDRADAMAFDLPALSI